MSADPIRTTNIDPGSQIFEFLGHSVVGGKRSTQRFPRAAVLGAYDAALGGAGAGGVVFQTKAAADVALNYPANQMAWVVADADPIKNGVYRKTGVSGVGGWTRVGDLPIEVLTISATGGSANAITGAIYPQVPAFPENKLFLFLPSQANTGPTTIAIPGLAAGAPVQIRNAFGATLAANSLLPDSQVLMAWFSGRFQLLISANVDASAILADAISAKNDAESAEASAASYAALLGTQAYTFDTRSQAAAATVPAPINYIRTIEFAALFGGGAVYARGAGPASFTTNGGTVTWHVINPQLNVCMFGAKFDGSADATAAFQAAADLGLTIDVPEGRFRIDGQVACPYGTHFRGTSTSSTIRPVGTGVGPSLLGPGSIILIPNNAVTPFLYYSGNCFEGLTFLYPNQSSAATTPTAYPATFARVPQNPSEVAVANVWRNLQFVNSYIWIDALPGHLEYTFQDLVGCAIYRGIMSDGCGGTDIFKQIRISSYYWGYGTAVTPWILANAQGLALGRIDHMFADDIYLSDMNVGVRLFKGVVNSATGIYGRFCNIGFEGCNYSFYVECTNNQGVLISNASLCARVTEFLIPGGNSDPVHLMVDGAYSWGPRNFFISCNKTVRVKLNGVTIDDPADINFGASTTASDLFMNGNEFTGGGTLRTSAQLNRMVLVGNGFGTTPTINSPAASTRRYSANLGLSDA